MTAHVIPPVNADAIASGNDRFGITSSMLVSSSVPEAPPPAHQMATTYPANQEVSTGVVGQVLSVWRSLKPGNTGNLPVEGEWWTLIGTTYAEWSAAQVYAKGDLVLRSATHMVYKRVTDGATAQEPEKDVTAVNWSVVGATNRWAMFDMKSANATHAIGPVTIKLRPGRITALAMLGVSDGRATLDMKDAYGATVWPPVTVALDTTPIYSWEDYFLAPFAAVGNIVRLDLPTYVDGVITISIEAGADFSLQWLVVGTAQSMGHTQRGPRVRNRNFSVIERNKNTGELQDIKRRKVIRLVSQRMWAPKSVVLRADAVLTSAESVPCVFVGLDSQEDAYAELLTLLGLCTSHEIDVAEVKDSIINIDVESV